MPFISEPMNPNIEGYRRESFRQALVLTDMNNELVLACDIFIISKNNCPRVAQVIKMLIESTVLDLRDEIKSNDNFMSQKI